MSQDIKVNEEVQEWVETLVSCWKAGELVEYAYQVTSLYGTLNYTLISNVMLKFKEEVS